MLKPLNGKVLIKENKPEEKSKGGLFLSPNEQEGEVKQGVVIAISSGLKRNDVIVEHSVKVGDTVLFGPYAGVEVEFEFEKYLMLADLDIYAVLDK